MPRYLMRFCYDGTHYHGWQKQHNGISIQAVMERALARMEAPQPFITAAGRTDTGVHALAQRAHFEYPSRMQTWQMVKAFNSLLPPDIKVLAIDEVAPSFHARFDACERGYIYLLAKEPHPFYRLYMGFIPHKPIRYEALQGYIPSLLGSHDFSSLGRANPNIPKRVCNLKVLTISDMGDFLEFRLLAIVFTQYGAPYVGPDKLAAKELPHRTGRHLGNASQTNFERHPAKISEHGLSCHKLALEQTEFADISLPFPPYNNES